ncbi:hypothetical protein V6Z11_A10G149800 [Gossypium hirsutum]
MKKCTNECFFVFLERRLFLFLGKASFWRLIKDQTKRGPAAVYGGANGGPWGSMTEAKPDQRPDLEKREKES